MLQSHTDIWLSDKAEERIVLECLLSFAKNYATGFSEKRIRNFAKTRTLQPYIEALKKMGVLSLQDGQDGVYILDPHKAIEYISVKGKNAAEILKRKYPETDLDVALAAYAKARKGNP